MQMWKPMGRCSAQWIFTKCLQDVSKCPWLGSLRESVSECIGLLSRVLPFATVARQASARGVLWARIPEWVAIPSPGDLPDPAIKLRDLAVQADCLPSEALIRYQGDVLSQRKAVWGRREEGDYQQLWREASWETSWHLCLGLPASRTWGENLVVSTTQYGFFCHGSPIAPKQS